MTTARILVIAADALARAGIAAILAAEDQVTVVGQAGPNDDLGQIAAIYRPNVALWDAGWFAPDEPDPAENRLVQTMDEAGVPVLAIAGDADTAMSLWDRGVHGVLDRSAHGGQISAAAQAILQGLRVHAPSLVPTRAYVLAPALVSEQARSVVEPALIEALTPRELDVLRLMANGLPNKLIARELAISENTVKFHVNAILSKLDAQSRTEAVVRATRMGVLLL